MNTLAILVAAGSGRRLGAARPKAFVNLGGKPLLLHSALRLQAAPRVDGIVVVVPEGEQSSATELLLPVMKVRAVVAGGPTRQDSVLEGLRQTPHDFEGVVLVHDAARPFVSVATIEAVIDGAQNAGAAIPVFPVSDTLKRVREGKVVETLDRSDLASAQTPQGFQLALLVRAYEGAFRERLRITDEAMAVERLGATVLAVPGSPLNHKITTPEDLAWAEALLGRGGVE